MIRLEEIRLPELSLDATEWDQRLLQALYDQWRDTNQRLWALETTLGIAPRKAGPVRTGYSTQTAATYTVLDSDYYLLANFAGTVTYTLPTATAGRQLLVRTITANTVVSASANVVPLAGGAAGTAILAATAGTWALLVSDGTNWEVMAA
jgi:hypothetical protein